MPRVPRKRVVALKYHHVIDDQGLTLRIDGLTIASEANMRGSWVLKEERKHNQQLIVGSAMASVKTTLGRFAEGPLKVVFTRFGGKRMDQDNLATAFKAVQDCAFYWLKRDDGEPEIDIQHKQDPGPAFAIMISVDRL